MVYALRHPGKIAFHEDVQDMPKREFARAVLARFGLPRPVEEVAGAVEAFVNDGRWLVRCPSCPTYEYASVKDPVFMCCGCGNYANGGRYYAVVFPAEREEVERLLLRRSPGPARGTSSSDRNFAPGETLEDLRAQNVALGVGEAD